MADTTARDLMRKDADSVVHAHPPYATRFDTAMGVIP
jgi:ribulose-5-phosphate 4-epimerase/fuculose-1-phosphate aldolase